MSGVTRGAKAQQLYTDLVQSIRQAGNSNLLHELEIEQLRQLDAAIQLFRERVAWARDIAIADKRAAEERRRA